MAIAHSEFDWRSTVATSVAQIEDLRFHENVGSLRSMTAGIHPDGTSNGSRDADEELQVPLAGASGCSGQQWQEGRSAGGNLPAFHVNPGEPCTKLSDDTVESTIGDQNIGPPAENQHGHRSLLESSEQQV